MHLFYTVSCWITTTLPQGFAYWSHLFLTAFPKNHSRIISSLSTIIAYRRFLWTVLPHEYTLRLHISQPFRRILQTTHFIQAFVPKSKSFTSIFLTKCCKESSYLKSMPKDFNFSLLRYGSVFALKGKTSSQDIERALIRDTRDDFGTFSEYNLFLLRDTILDA